MSSGSADGTTTAARVDDLRGSTRRLPPMRRTIAARMLESLQTSAQLTTVVECDVTDLQEVRSARRERFAHEHGVNLTLLPYLALAAVRALRANPVVNAELSEDGRSVTYHDVEHLAIAVDTERGLVAPVVRDAGQMDLTTLALAIRDVAERARAGTLGYDELEGGTFTLTNTGSRGALFDTPIINQPQVAILGTGAVVERPVAVRDETGRTVTDYRKLMFLALSYDHRLVDGSDAARYLGSVRSQIDALAADPPT